MGIRTTGVLPCVEWRCTWCLLRTGRKHEAACRHRGTGRIVLVLSGATAHWMKVELLHESGRKTTKQVPYFLCDYEPCKYTAEELNYS